MSTIEQEVAFDSAKGEAFAGELVTALNKAFCPTISKLHGNASTGRFSQQLI